MSSPRHRRFLSMHACPYLCSRVIVKGHQSRPKNCSNFLSTQVRSKAWMCTCVSLGTLAEPLSRPALNTVVRICHGCYEWRSAAFPLMEHYQGWCHPILLTRKCSYYTCNYMVTILLQTTTRLCHITSSSQPGGKKTCENKHVSHFLHNLYKFRWISAQIPSSLFSCEG